MPDIRFLNSNNGGCVTCRGGSKEVGRAGVANAYASWSEMVHFKLGRGANLVLLLDPEAAAGSVQSRFSVASRCLAIDRSPGWWWDGVA